MNYYKVPIVDGQFKGVNYSDILEGIAHARHVEQGYGYICTSATYDLERVSEEIFNAERMV